MLKVLRTYRIVALLSAFAIVSTAFAPLASVCGMDMAETAPESDVSETLPCHSLGDNSNTGVEQIDAGSQDSSNCTSEMASFDCCVAQGLATHQVERTVPPSAQVSEVVLEAVTSPIDRGFGLVAIDESPPPLTVALHLLLGRFLT